MKSRRRIAFSQTQDHAELGLQCVQSNQEIQVAGMGLMTNLHRNNHNPLMSAPGPKAEALGVSIFSPLAFLSGHAGQARRWQTSFCQVRRKGLRARSSPDLSRQSIRFLLKR
jgi:hypothetical protein